MSLLRPRYHSGLLSLTELIYINLLPRNRHMLALEQWRRHV